MHSSPPPFSRSATSGTVFAPSNDAFTPEVERVLSEEPARAEAILGLHFVERRISGEDVRVHRPQNEHKMYSAPVPYPPRASSKEVGTRLLLPLLRH